MLRLMRRWVVWFVIAALWFVVAVFTSLQRGWKQAWLQALIACLFLGVGLYFRRKDLVR
jgi:threonine/homoserine/homoserine lactone efflux protein